MGKRKSEGLSMFCRYCGKELPDDARFCRYCGKQVAGESPQPAPPQPQPVAQPQPAAPPQPVAQQPAVQPTPPQQPISPGFYPAAPQQPVPPRFSPAPPQPGFFQKYGKVLIGCVGVLALVILVASIASTAGRSTPAGSYSSSFSGTREEKQEDKPRDDTQSIAASVLPKVPDPARYFAPWDPDAAKLSKDATDYTVSVEFPSHAEAADALNGYLDLLEDSGFAITGEEEEGDSLLVFCNGPEGTRTVSRFGYSAEPASLALTYHRGAYILMVHYSALLTPDSATPKAEVSSSGKSEASDSETKTGTKTESKTETKTETKKKPETSSGKIDSSNVQVPDFGAFSGIDLEPAKEKKLLTATQKDYFFQTNEKVIEEYIKLLTEKYNFKVRKDSDSVSRTVMLDYTGTGSVSTFEARKEKGVSVYLWIYLTPSTEFHITYGDGLEYVDNGDRTTQTVKRDESSGGSGGSSGDSGSRDKNIPEFAQQDCTACDGSGKCKECGGSGYLHSRASDKEDRNCWKCNTTGKCRTCGGSGKR